MLQTLLTATFCHIGAYTDQQVVQKHKNTGISQQGMKTKEDSMNERHSIFSLLLT